MGKNILFLPSLVLPLIVLAGCSAQNDLAEIPAEEVEVEERTLPGRVADEVTPQNLVENNPLNTPMENNSAEESTLRSKFSSAIIKTNMGNIKVSLFTEDAPATTENFLKLSQSNFFNRTKFHRVIKDFMIQGGDPLSKDEDWSNDGTGGPGYTFKDEFNSHKLVRGSLAMANSGPNTNGSQFFIVTANATPWLDGKHTNFGAVVEGMDVVEKIENMEADENDHPLKNATIESIELIEKTK